MHEGTINFSFKAGIVLTTSVSFQRMNLLHGVVELVGIIYKHIVVDVANVLLHVMKCMYDLFETMIYINRRLYIPCGRILFISIKC
jgi:hypothetical protein